jgi:catechol 2,3-dioxygenase-like lactoylglutathione lyase family enzyme
MDWTLEVVALPVTDVDRAKSFYVDQVGFACDLDDTVGGERFVQLTPPGSGCSVTIGTRSTRAEPGTYEGLQLVVADIEAARAHLVAAGVDASVVRHVDRATGEWRDGHGGRWNAFVFFDDPDGNSWTVQERPTSG